MNIRALTVLSVAVIGSSLSGPALAARAPGVSVAQIIGRFARPIEAIPFPVVGTVGKASIDTLPGLLHLSIPGVGTSLPVVGEITVANGVVIVQSIKVLQHIKVPSLPGITTPSKH